MTTLTHTHRQPPPTATISSTALAASTILAAILLPLGLVHLYVVLITATAGTLAVIAGAIDARTRRLPNTLVAPTGVLALVQAGALSIARADPATIAGAALAAAVLGVLYALMAFAGWVGVGDVKYIAVLGLLLGTFIGTAATAIAPIAVVLASMHRGAAAVLHKEVSRRLPHGPAILVAAGVVLTVVPLGLA